MSQTVNAGANFEILNISVGSSTDTPIEFDLRFINSIIIQCRGDADLQLRRNSGDDEYITIFSGSSFTLDCAVSDKGVTGTVVAYLRSISGIQTVEVLGTI